MSALSAAAKPLIGRGYRLQWEPAQGAHVLLYPEGMVKLNSTAGEIMSRCDGERMLTEIIADLEHTFGVTGLSDDVTAFVTMAIDRNWLEIRT